MSDEASAYERLYNKLYDRCQQLQDENERLAYRTNHIKKLTHGYIRDVEILKRRLNRHNDNWQSVPIVLPHPKRKTEQKRGPKPKTQNQTQTQINTPPVNESSATAEKKVRKPRAKKVDKETLVRQQQEAALLRQQQLEKRQQRQKELQELKLKQKEERQMQKQVKQMLQQKLKEQKQKMKLNKLEQQQFKKQHFPNSPYLTMRNIHGTMPTSTVTSAAAAAALASASSSAAATSSSSSTPTSSSIIKKFSTIQLAPTNVINKPVSPMFNVASKVSTTFLTPQRQQKPSNIGDMKMPPPPPPPKIEHFTENQAHMLLMHKPLQILPKQRLPKQALR